MCEQLFKALVLSYLCLPSDNLAIIEKDEVYRFYENIMKFR